MGLFRKKTNANQSVDETAVNQDFLVNAEPAEEIESTSEEAVSQVEETIPATPEANEIAEPGPVSELSDISESSAEPVIEATPVQAPVEASASVNAPSEIQDEQVDEGEATAEKNEELVHEPAEEEASSPDAEPVVEEEEEEIPLDPEVLEEIREIEEDLSVLDGRILPELKVPNWREELEFVKERYEPCDLTDHIVKVSKRRLVARRIDHELAQSRLTAFNRYLERATRRFKVRIDEDAVLNEALADISQWRSDQAKSVSWLLVDRINQEVLKAKQAEMEATAFVEQNTEFTNKGGIETYRKFARSLFVIPLSTAYVMSVVALTYTNFEWIMKFFPFFNLGLAKTQYMIAGVSSYFLLRAFWRYSGEVARTQRKLSEFIVRYEEQEKKIKHAVAEHTRLSQQQPLVEPILQVLSKAYRVQLQSDVTIKAKATTAFDPETLPACVTLARAIDDEEDKMARMKRRALNVLMSPGWRTRGLNEIASIHADARMLDAHALSLSSLDSDSMVSTTSAQKLLLEAFGNTSIHERVSKRRLVAAIKEIHAEVLANWDSGDRPSVVSLRNDGFNKIAFRTSWLADEDASEPWIPFLTEILSEETSPFGQFNILDKSAELNDPSRISSVAVVPHYFPIKESRVKIQHSKSKEVMPLDVVVRVDVSPWSEPHSFAVFADDVQKMMAIPEPEPEATTAQEPKKGVTGA